MRPPLTDYVHACHGWVVEKQAALNVRLVAAGMTAEGDNNVVHMGFPWSHTADTVA